MTSTIKANAINSVVVRQVTYSYSTGAYGDDYTNLKTLIDADLPSGYTCLGIVGFTSNSGSVVISSARYVDSNWSLQMRNLGSGTISNNAIIYYMAYR